MTVAIGWTGVALAFLLLIPALAIIAGLRLGQLKSAVIGIGRMTLQLLLVGFFLVYLFEQNEPLLTLAWFLVMLGVAAGSVVRRSTLRLRVLLLPSALSLTLAATPILFYFTAVILRLDQPLEARYFIALGGMLLGNSLRGNIVGMSTFYASLRENQHHHRYMLSLGATRLESISPYLQESMRRAISPTLAATATMGIVFLPGMMTGQVLGGAPPLVAVHYQIAIMLSIFACVAIATLLGIVLSVPAAFEKSGVLDESIFR
jgi:putative ABC transport system permease protein